MIDHDKLLAVMWDLGFPTDAIDVVTSIRTRRPRSNGAQTTQTPSQWIEAAYKALSPFLFLIYIEPLLRWLHVGAGGLRTDASHRRRWTRG
jgi:hypothetical protein